ncbi:TPA: DUF1972 domain-containing protein [Providencia rettgeri]|nr:DUF1972 domain-containing protein [Providencia rettgeri]ELQ1457760.1 DUF1972 domain-containing protein [Providencia rettgeri]ELR5187729.1 DUF1972 domain-containing protein [Providencia rettgeri]EMB0752233.1 DUF1972 domain-containing protein [Providencia rettgeri]HEM7509414.1 DUF1972 domain-containing protein [Providencia rettgeri]
MKNKYKIAVVGTVGLPANYGGFETLVENLTTKDAPIDMIVFCSSKNYDYKLKTYKNASLIYLPIKANGISSIFYDSISLLIATFKKTDSILLLGVSGACILPIINLFYRGKIVTNIDGLEWKRNKWGKITKYFLKFCERIAVKYSSAIIADNQAIADYVLQEYNIVSTVIAYGGDHAISYPKKNNLNILPIEYKEYSLALCRIEPENNIHTILSSYSKTQENLVFIGNWDNSTYGKELKSKYSKYKNIKILDPIYDIGTLFEIRKKCSVYIHGHSAGGTNPSLVEMMFFNKIIVCYDCSYNRSTTENKAIYFSNETELLKIINNRTNLNEDISRDMFQIANDRYLWAIVKQQYLDLLIKKDFE